MAIVEAIVFSQKFSVPSSSQMIAIVQNANRVEGCDLPTSEPASMEVVAVVATVASKKV